MITNTKIISKEIAPTLLWSNDNPSASFAPQVISFDSNYSAFLVEIRSTTSDATTAVIYLPIGLSSQDIFATRKSGSGQGWRLVNSVNAGSIDFGNGIRTSSSGSSANNSYAIPVNIWGVVEGI